MSRTVFICLFTAVLMGLPSAADSVQLKPGKWTTKSVISMQGLTPRESTSQTCMTSSDVKMSAERLAEQLTAEMGCKPADIKNYNSAMTFRLHCDQSPGIHGAPVVITYTEQQYEMMADIGGKFSGENIPSGDIELRSKFEGACED